MRFKSVIYGQAVLLSLTASIEQGRGNPVCPQKQSYPVKQLVSQLLNHKTTVRQILLSMCQTFITDTEEQINRFSSALLKCSINLLYLICYFIILRVRCCFSSVCFLSYYTSIIKKCRIYYGLRLLP